MFLDGLLLAGVFLKHYSYKLQPSLSGYGGWQLDLLSDDVRVDKRTFSVTPAQASPGRGIWWWNAIVAEERDHWMRIARSARPADAYRAFLLASAYIDAEAHARVWLSARAVEKHGTCKPDH